MSYLTLPGGIPDFSTAVISLWFSVPRESVIAAYDHRIELGVAGWSMLQSVIPLITFGRQQKNKNYALISENVVHGSEAEVFTPTHWQAGEAADIDPSFIGIACYSDGTFDMQFNIQMGNEGTYTGLIWFVTSLSYISGFEGSIPLGSGIIGATYQSTIEDGTHGSTNDQSEFFFVQTDLFPRLEPDIWHHVLLSFNIEGTLVAGDLPSSNCGLWYAIDDKDYRGPENMAPFRNPDDGLGPNVIMTRNIWRNYGPQPENPMFSNYFLPDFSATYSPGLIPSGDAELGIPAATRYVDGIFRVELAEFQMWTGVTVDTQNTEVRRAFIDYTAGNAEEGGILKPVNPRVAEEFMGRRPDIMLHGSSDWKNGKNTGSTGINDDGVEIPEGQFEPVALIKRYKPDPAIAVSAA